MSKTGGGRGTNQYRVRGESVKNYSSPTPTRHPTASNEAGGEMGSRADSSSGEPTFVQWPKPDFPDPDANNMYTASRKPWWDERRLAALVADVAPQGVDRAVRRYQSRIAGHIQSDAQIEGNTFTLPEVETLLHGHHVAGHTEGEANMIEDMRVASDDLTEKVQTGPLEVSQGLSDDLHVLLARHSEIPSLDMRADWPGRNTGPQVALGGGVRFQSLPRGELRTIFDEGLHTISSIENPVQRAATWAAFATYHQFYWDGNKRTGRYVMNAVAMSHGYDSISIPNNKSTEYLAAVLLSYKTADLTPHIRFLLEKYDDR